jgi:hypothetical protein
MEAVYPFETQEKSKLLHRVKMQTSTISTSTTANTKSCNKVGSYEHFNGA